MTLEINGKTIPVDFAHLFTRTDVLHIGLTDARKMSEIAKDFETAAVIKRKSSTQGDCTYNGYNRIVRITREDDVNSKIIIVLGKEKET